MYKIWIGQPIVFPQIQNDRQSLENFQEVIFIHTTSPTFTPVLDDIEKKKSLTFDKEMVYLMVMVN